MSSVAEVVLWGRVIGAVSVAGPGAVAAFEYTPAFRESGVEVAPLMMTLRGPAGGGGAVYRFPGLPRGSFHGLPGLLADALPDKFGNAVIDAWLVSRGRLPNDIDAVERLCYTGSRGMGALEFRPVLGTPVRRSTPLRVDALVSLASEVLAARGRLDASFADDAKEETLRDILRVGASAGGARAKAVIAWNPDTNEVRSGQTDVPPGFEHWLLKFDGVSGNADKEAADAQGYGAIEYAYALMAAAAGIDMMPCRLLEEGGRRHFMTRRFDRPHDAAGRATKLHAQSLGALGHFDFNHAGGHSYEQAFVVMRRLGLGADAAEAMYRRMVFNVLARNQDDHVKNIAFLMDRAGRWSLSPAFDVTYSYNPDGAWTSRHQMSLNGKRDGFDFADLRAVATHAGLVRRRDRRVLADVEDAVRRWPDFAAAAGVPEATAAAIGATFRTITP